MEVSFFYKSVGSIGLIAYRDFLLFVPHGTPSLRAILTYYTATGNVNSEGDVHVNDTLKGLGNYSFLCFTIL